MALTVTKIHPDLWEEADKAGLLWEQGLPGHNPGYLRRMRANYGLTDGTFTDIKARLNHTSPYYRIGLLTEE